MLSHILTPDQLGCVLFASPFVVLAVAFIASELTRPGWRFPDEQPIAAPVHIERAKIADRLPGGM